jgi:hypothetical protein
MLMGELNTKMDDRLKGHWIRNKPPKLVVVGTIFSHLKHHKVTTECRTIRLIIFASVRHDENQSWMLGTSMVLTWVPITTY